MNFITPTILIVISLGVFFSYINPNYRGTNDTKPSVQILQKEYQQYDEALNNSNALREKRESLIKKKNDISADQLNQLEELLPDNIDNIKLVINIKNIAQNHNLILKNIKLGTNTLTDPNKLGSENTKYGNISLSFSVNSSYDTFQNFLRDLEKSLRLVDITELSVLGNDLGLYEFSVTLKTYWLK